MLDVVVIVAGSVMVIGAILVIAGYYANKWSKGVDTKLEGFGTKLDSFTQKIGEQIAEIFSRLPPVPVAGSSPLQLTEFGRKMAAFLDAETWASEDAQILRPKIGGMEAWQIDAQCANHVRTALTPQMRDRVAECAYNFGVEQEGVQKVLQVVLRDELLKDVQGHRAVEGG